VKPGKGAAFIRTKMKNYLTGNTVEKTFRAGSTVTIVFNLCLFYSLNKLLIIYDRRIEFTS
jgi:hypothetical protein